MICSSPGGRSARRPADYACHAPNRSDIGCDTASNFRHCTCRPLGSSPLSTLFREFFLRWDGSMRATAHSAGRRVGLLGLRADPLALQTMRAGRHLLHARTDALSVPRPRLPVVATRRFRQSSGGRVEFFHRPSVEPLPERSDPPQIPSPAKRRHRRATLARRFSDGQWRPRTRNGSSGA